MIITEESVAGVFISDGLRTTAVEVIVRNTLRATSILSARNSG